jgi:hypothetical protein
MHTDKTHDKKNQWQSKEDFILYLSQQLMHVEDQETKLAAMLIRDVGIRWKDILDDGLETYLTNHDKEGYRQFMIDFLTASSRTVAWVLLNTVIDYLDESQTESFIDDTMLAIGKHLKRTWRERQDMLRETAQSQPNEASHAESHSVAAGSNPAG